MRTARLSVCPPTTIWATPRSVITRSAPVRFSLRARKLVSHVHRVAARCLSQRPGSMLSTMLRRTAPRLHFLGLFSDGNVHSHIDHLQGYDRAKQRRRACVPFACTFCSTDVMSARPPRLITSIPLKHSSQSLRSPDFDVKIASGGGTNAGSPWTATRQTGRWSSAAGRRTCSARVDMFASAEEAVKTLPRGDPRNRSGSRSVRYRKGRQAGRHDRGRRHA